MPRASGIGGSAAPDGPCPWRDSTDVTVWQYDRLEATVRHFAPHARFTDLTGVSVAPESGGPLGYPHEVVAGLIELIGLRRLGWLLGVAASVAVLVVGIARSAASGTHCGPRCC